MDNFRCGAHLMPGANFQALIASVASSSEQNVTWNPSDKDTDITLSNSDRDAASSGAGSVRSLLGRSSGKYYWEVLIQTGVGNLYIGFANSSYSITNTYPGSAASSAGVASGGNAVNTWTKDQAGTFTISVGDVLGFALDLSNGKAWVSKNNTWQLTGDPAAGTNQWVSGITGTIYPTIGWVASFAAGGRICTKTAELTYSPPSGFSRWAAP